MCVCLLVSFFLSFFLFCEKVADRSGLHIAQTLTLDANVQRHAELLQDQELNQKLRPRDVVAMEAKYHKNCLAAFYMRKSVSHSENADGNSETELHTLAFEELVGHIESFH